MYSRMFKSSVSVCLIKKIILIYVAKIRTVFPRHFLFIYLLLLIFAYNPRALVVDLMLPTIVEASIAERLHAVNNSHIALCSAACPKQIR